MKLTTLLPVGFQVMTMFKDLIVLVVIILKNFLNASNNYLPSQLSL